MDIISYFTHLTGLMPTEDQESFLLDIEDATKKQIIGTAGCQSGKTLCSALGALWWIFESNQRVNVLLVSAQDSILYYHIREIFKKHPELSEQLTSPFSPNLIPFKGFEVKNGNQCFVRGSTEKQLSGIPASIVFIDEACLVPNNLIFEGLNRISSEPHKIILISTPSKPSSIFVEWATDSKSGFVVHQWSSEGLHWHDAVIDKSKKKKGPAWYAIYMLGRPPTKRERAFFPSKDIDMCIKETVERERLPYSEIWAGLDWGQSIGETVLTINEKLHGRRKILYVKRYRKQMLEIILPEIKQTLDLFKPDVVKCDSRPSWAVDMARRVIPGIIPVDAAFNKTAMLAQLLRKIKSHQLDIPESQVDLIKQLTTYLVGKRAGDDIVDSLALSIFETSEEITPGKTIVHIMKERRR